MEHSASLDQARQRSLIDAERLSSWMNEQDLPGGVGEPITIQFIAGGASNEIFEIRRGGHRMVLRSPPNPVPEGRNETMLREYRVLAALSDTDVPHPRALGACEDTGVIGSTFYVMDHIEGWSPITADDWPSPFDTDQEARQGLAYQLVDGIAKLSKVDWRARGREGFGRPEGFHERQVDRWQSHLSKFQFREIPGLDVAAQWLRDHKPTTYEPGISHGDYQFANVMFH